MQSLQPGISSPAQQQGQKPTAEELKIFFNSARVNPPVALQLIEKYGKNIINESSKKVDEDPIFITAARSSLWSGEEFEKLLKTPGLNVNIQRYDITSLEAAMEMSAVFKENPPLNQIKKIQLLIDHGIDINQLNTSGATSLINAAKNHQPKVVSMLLTAGASTEGAIKQDFYKGKTFFDFAKQDPAVWAAYQESLEYKKNVAAEIAKRLADISHLGKIVGEYL